MRVISATNRDLSQAVANGTFREDLYYRLKVISINIPPLRERIEDIPVLTEFFLRNIAAKMNKKIQTFENEILSMMMRYPWPGNIRELKNLIESAVVVSNETVICEDDIEGTDLYNYNLEIEKTSNIDITYKQDSGIDLKSNERELIIAALKKANWVQKDAARLLGISNRVINYKIQKMQIDCKTRTY